MAGGKEIEERIDNHISGWKAPFDDYSGMNAKLSVMQRITLIPDQENENRFQKKEPKSYFWLKVAAVMALIFAGGAALLLLGNSILETN